MLGRCVTDSTRNKSLSFFEKLMENLFCKLHQQKEYKIFRFSNLEYINFIKKNSVQNYRKMAIFEKKMLMMFFCFFFSAFASYWLYLYFRNMLLGSCATWMYMKLGLWILKLILIWCLFFFHQQLKNKNWVFYTTMNYK